MKLTEISAPEFDLAKTLESGQIFHWEKIDSGFCGAIGDRAVYVEQKGDLLKCRAGKTGPDCLKQSRSKSKDGDRGVGGVVAHYFALDHPLAQICASFPQDETMNAARDFCGGLRIIRQPKWECLATFICSSMKQVAHIRQISQTLRRRFGEARSPQRVRPMADKIERHIVYTFPSAARVAKSSEKELRNCALGYRAKNLLVTARLVAKGDVDLEKMGTLSDVDLRAKLCMLPGVGAKVANCVMLFAYERLRAFPIDVWIERVLRENYFPRARKLNAERLRTFTQEHFGEHGGYAQQYLFHYARMKGRSGTIRDSSTALRSGRNDREGARMASRKSGTGRGFSRLRGATAWRATSLEMTKKSARINKGIGGTGSVPSQNLGRHGGRPSMTKARA